MERTVLLVDDDERLLSGLIRALHKQPFRIFIDKEVSGLEFSSLMESVGWGSNYSEELIQCGRMG